ncbi:MAG: YHS domain-containing protein [Armatimonadota bacterium]|jgi:YHS domain-containing protein
MKKTIIIAALIAALGVSVTPVFTSIGQAGRKAPAKASKKVVSAVCPVMGSKIPDVTKAAGKSVYKGKTYYFCCAGCKPKFDKNPAKYAK